MPAKNIGKTLKKLRLKAGLSQKQAYEYIGVVQSTFSSWETGKAEPPNEVLLKLCDLYHVDDILTAFGYDGYKEDGSIQLNMNEIDIVEKYRFILKHSSEGAQAVDAVLDKEYSIANTLKEQREYIIELEKLSQEEHQRDTKTRLINYYYRLASAGTGQIIFDTPPTKRIEIPDIPKYKNVDYAIGVNGVSMEPIYKDNDTLLVEMTDEVDKGEIGIFSVDNNCYVKKRGEKELISLNPNFHNIPINESARCMGRVIDRLNNI